MSIVTILSGTYIRGKGAAAKGGAVYLKIRSSYRNEELIEKIPQTTLGVWEVKSINIDVLSHLALED